MSGKIRQKGKYALTVLLCVLCAQTALAAAGPGEYSAFDEARLEKLMDNTAEWEEIPDLVTCYNPTYRIYADSAASTDADLTQAGDSFKEEMDRNLEVIEQGLQEIREQREKLAGLPGWMVIDENGTTVGQMLTMLDATEASLKESRRALKQGTGKALTSITSIRITTDESLKPVREQITHAVEGLFISYEELQVNRSLVGKQILLYETILATQESLKKEEMATSADVDAARASLEEAKTTLAVIDNGLDQLRSAVGLQLGWDADHAPELGKVPDPVENFPETVDKDADYRQALENNAEYGNTKELKNYKGSAAVERRDAALNEANAAAGTKFDELYTAMLKQKLLYEASETSLRRAALTKEQAGRMYRLGLMGNAEYRGKELEYLSCEASVALNRLAYISAINEYQWAVRGYMEY